MFQISFLFRTTPPPWDVFYYHLHRVLGAVGENIIILNLLYSIPLANAQMLQINNEHFA